MQYMNKQYSVSLFIFRRDLRLHDNIALNAALKQSDKVIPCFIFDERQIGTINSYKSNNALQFMIESLENIKKELSSKKSTLYFFYGIAEEIVAKLTQNTPIEAIFINRDYTPFSR